MVIILTALPDDQVRSYREGGVYWVGWIRQSVTVQYITTQTIAIQLQNVWFAFQSQKVFKMHSLPKKMIFALYKYIVLYKSLTQLPKLSNLHPSHLNLINFTHPSPKLQQFKQTIKHYSFTMRQIIDTGQYVNRNLIKQNRIAAGAIFFLQVTTMFFHGFFVRPKSTLPTTQQLNDLLPTTGVALLVLIGFGLIFSAAKNNIWSSIGFTFFITVITVQLYHLISGFWTLVSLNSFNFSLIWSQTFPVYLTDRDALNVATFGNTAIGALKCSLANSVAFAAISGRGGLLAAFIVTVVGTVIYELNRQIIGKFCQDFGGSISIFCWGGIYGSVISLIMYFRKHKNTAQQNQHRIAGKLSYTLVGIGALFCWVFFPFLNSDIPVSLVYSYQGGVNAFYSISAAVLTSVGLCCLFVGQLNFKDFVYSPVVGGVIVGTSSAFITNSVGSILLGIGAGLFHFLFQRWQTKIKWYFLIQNNVLFLYGIQGMFGGLLSAIFVQIAHNDESTFANSSILYALPSFSGQLIATAITIGTAIATGIVVGLILAASTQMKRQDHYHDRAFWLIEQDCISQKSDINELSELYLSEQHSQQVLTEKHVQVYREVLIPAQRGDRNKFVQL